MPLSISSQALHDSLNPVATIVATAGVEGTVPLYLYYNEAKKDHLTCALKSTCAASGYVSNHPNQTGFLTLNSAARFDSGLYNRLSERGSRLSWANGQEGPS